MFYHMDQEKIVKDLESENQAIQKNIENLNVLS